MYRVLQLGAEQRSGTVLELDIAVIIVTYRSAQLTIDSLSSIQAERLATGMRIRAIVVDNASGDLPAISHAVEAHDWSLWVTCVLAPKNGGFAYGNNFGILRAYDSGRPAYVHLLNPDAQVRPGAIRSLVEFLESHLDVGIAGSSFENLDGSDWPIAFRFPSLLSELNSRLEIGVVTSLLRRWVVAQHMTRRPQPVDWVCGASMMIRPEVFDAIGGFDEHYFLYFEETDFCFRAKQAGYPTWYAPQSRVMHIAGQSTKVDERNAGPRRMPAYWFESRRRYFAMTFGTSRAVAIDIVAISAHAIGLLKRVALLRMRSAIPHFLRDLVHYSILWPQNRRFPEVQSMLPRG